MRAASLPGIVSLLHATTAFTSRHFTLPRVTKAPAAIPPLQYFASLPEETKDQLLRDYTYFSLAVTGLAAAGIQATVTTAREMSSRCDSSVESCGEGPVLPSSALLAYGQPLTLLDIVAVVGRIESMKDLRFPADVARENGESRTLRGMQTWHNRTSFKEVLRKASWKNWPIDAATGEPCGGLELAERFVPIMARSISPSSFASAIDSGNDSTCEAWPLPDVVMDAFFDACTGGSSGDVATPEDVAANLIRWRPATTEPPPLSSKQIKMHQTSVRFDIAAFERAVIAARVKFLGAALFLVAFQVFLYNAVVIKPVLRDFFGIGDIPVP